MNFLKLKKYSMAEVIKHTLGITTIFSYIGSYIKCKFKQALAYTHNTWQKIKN